MNISPEIISALLGTAGVSSFLVVFKNKARSSQVIARLDALKANQNTLDPSSHAYKAAEQAIMTESLRLTTFSLQRKSMLEKITPFMLVAALIFVMFLVLGVIILEFIWPIDKTYGALGLAGAALFSLFYGALAGFGFVVIDQRDNEREFYKQLVKIPVVMKSSEVTHARKYVCRETRKDKRKRQNKNWANQQDQKWARARAKVQKHKL